MAWMGLIADERPAMAHVLRTAGITHGKGMQSYLTMMAIRLLEMHRVLKATGSIYLHCDSTASHYLKLLMDAVFGGENFRNEVVWSYQRWTGATRHFQRMHDSLLYFAKSREAVFNQLSEPHSPKGLHRHKGKTRITKVMPDGALNQTYVSKGGTKAMRDVWEISYLNANAHERIGYPTQKPLALLDRIIKASSNEGDMVLDPFCGCATACVAADRLNRKWVGIDISGKAVELVNMRLKQTMGSLFHHGYVTARTDIPQPTDVEKPKPYRQNKHVLFGQQEGLCNGCKGDFPFKLYEIDHIVPQSKGGTDHIENLQILCGSCNKIKGDRPQEYLMAHLQGKEVVYA